MILCITPNAAIDRTLITPTFQPGEVVRAAEVIVAAGGKGLNVARAVKTLEDNAVCMGLLGGHNGRFLADLAQKEGLEAVWTWFAGETRTCLIIVAENGRATVINEPGVVPNDTWGQFQQDIRRQAQQAVVACLSGSLPRGAPANAPTDLVQTIKATGCPVWVDTSGVALRNVLAAAPTGLKVNGEEAGEAVGITVDGPDTALQAAKHMRQLGIGTVVLTLGQQGAVLVNETGSWWARSPAVTAVSAVGSGDAFLAGLVTALTKGNTPEIALCHGVAAGTANTLSSGVGRFSLEEFCQILSETTLSTLRDDD